MFQQYPDSIAAVIQTGPDTPGGDQLIHLGPIEMDNNQQLEVYRVQIYKRGFQPAVQMYLRAYQGVDYLGQSATVRISSIEDKYGETENFYGWVCFVFSPRINSPAGIETNFDLVLTGYNYASDDSVFIAAVLDWPITMGYNETVGSINDAPFAIELYGV